MNSLPKDKEIDTLQQYHRCLFGTYTEIVRKHIITIIQVNRTAYLLEKSP